MCSDLYNNHPNKQHWGPVLSKEEGGRVKFTQNTSIQQLLQLLIQPLPSVYTWGQLNHDVVVSFPHSPWVRALREETFKFLSYKLLGVLGWWARKGYGENRISNCFTSSNKWEHTGFGTSHTRVHSNTADSRASGEQRKHSSSETLIRPKLQWKLHRLQSLFTPTQLPPLLTLPWGICIPLINKFLSGAYYQKCFGSCWAIGCARPWEAQNNRGSSPSLTFAQLGRFCLLSSSSQGI